MKNIYIQYCLLILVILITQSSQECLKECCETLKGRTKQTYTFYQNTGRFVGGSGQWTIDTKGYSGQGDGYLNPKYQCVVNVGPLPNTTYTLGYCKNVMHETTTRPCSFYLSPNNESEMCGRSDFFIHGCQCCTEGDETVPPIGGCSAGCVVINFENRIKLRVGDLLIVISYEDEKETAYQNHLQLQEKTKEQVKSMLNFIDIGQTILKTTNELMENYQIQHEGLQKKEEELEFIKEQLKKVIKNED